MPGCHSKSRRGLRVHAAIEMRVDELVAGVKADVAVLIYGAELEALNKIGKQIETVLDAVISEIARRCDGITGSNCERYAGANRRTTSANSIGVP